MVITYPRSFPSVGLPQDCRFSQNYLQETSPTRGGVPVTREFGAALWIASFSILTRNRAEFDEWDAWFNSLRGSLREFYAPNLLRPRPLAHPTSWPAGFSGSAVLSNVTDNGRVLVLSSAATGLVISPGDFLSFDYASGARRAFHQVVAGGTSSGGALNLEVSPALRLGWSAGASVSFNAPKAKMVLQGDPARDFKRRRGAITFQAMQVV